MLKHFVIGCIGVCVRALSAPGAVAARPGIIACGVSLLAISLSLKASLAAVVNVDFGLTPYTGASANGPLVSGTTWNTFALPTTTSLPSGTTLNLLLDDNGTRTNVHARFGSGWAGAFNDTGPNNLQRDRAYTVGGTGAFTIGGLNPGGAYNLALITAPDGTGVVSTNFTIGTTTLNAYGGSAGSNVNGPLNFTAGTTHALFNNVIASSSGDITFSTTKAALSTFGVLAGLQIEGSFPGAPPVILYDDFSEDPKISTEWTRYSYRGTENATVTWNSTEQDLSLVKGTGDWITGLYRTGASRSGTDPNPVTMTVTDLGRSTGTWGFLGLMITAVPQQNYITDAGDSYTLAMVPMSATTFRYEVRRTYADGASNFQLYTGPVLMFADSDPYQLDIVRSGDNYLFLANGSLLYTSGVASGDFYDTAAKDSMVYYQIVFGGDGAMTATVDNFGVVPEPSAALLLLSALACGLLVRRRR